MSSVSPRSYKDFTTRRIILEKVVNRSLGHESVNPPEGWKWDHCHLIANKITETLPFPGLKPNHLLSLPRKYWQNGPISGKENDSIKVEKIIETFSKGRLRWTPVIHNGDINIWRDSTYFFSDDSVVEMVSASNIDLLGHSLHILQRDLRVNSPILATIFRRDRNNEYLSWRSYKPKEQFTGILDANENQLTTRSGDSFYWDNVDTTKREFVSYIKDDSVYCLFNQFVVEAVTSLSTPSTIDDFNDLEYLGTSDGSDNQKFESSKFPISNDNYLSVYVVDISSSSWDIYTVVEEFSAVNQVILDEDLGIFTFGSSAGLSTPPIAGASIYIRYRATPRVEYEEEGYSEVSIAIDADVNPLSQSMNRGFVTLSKAQLDVFSISLETTKASYSGIAGTFGPVYVGADYASLLATVYSSSGEIVPNVEVTFFFETTNPFGGLGGSRDTSQRRTGFDGIARSFYIPPPNVDSMGFYVTEITPGNILEVSTEANFIEEQDIYTYYILKDDPLIGIAGADTSIGEIEWNSTNLNGRKVIAYKWDSSAINPISGKLGAYVPVRPSSITDGYVLTYSDTLAVPDINGYGSLTQIGNIDEASSDWIQDISESWTNNEWAGHVLYNSPEGYRRIVSNNSDTLYLSSPFENIPSGAYGIYDKTANIGAYWIVSDRFITIRASAYSPRLGRTIYSNPLNLRIEIPEYMKGSYISESLKELPFGWRIVDDITDQASAVNGATFISINPVAGPYPIVDVINGETWDNYSGDDPYAWWPYEGYPSSGVSAPFAHFSLTWNIEL